jgi:hypothetical protein
VQIVFNLYLSTKPLRAVYFLPVGNFTRSHFGFAWRFCGLVITDEAVISSGLRKLFIGEAFCGITSLVSELISSGLFRVFRDAQ